MGLHVLTCTSLLRCLQSLYFANHFIQNFFHLLKSLGVLMSPKSL